VLSFGINVRSGHLQSGSRPGFLSHHPRVALNFVFDGNLMLDFLLVVNFIPR